MKHGMSRPFIESRDLRVMLVMSAKDNSPEMRTLFDSIKYDDMLKFDESKNVFDYAGNYPMRRSEWKRKNAENNILVGSSSLQNIMWGATAVIAGSGPSYNANMVARAKGAGSCIISVGNNIWSNNQADYWVGRQSLDRYTSLLLSNNTALKFFPHRTQKSRYFQESLGRHTGPLASEIPGAQFYNKAKLLFQEPSSLSVAFSVAAYLGFSTIITTGVDLGPSADDRWYVMPERVPAPNTVVDKTERYSLVRQALPSIKKKLHSIGIRWFNIGSTLGEVVPELDPGFTIEALSGIRSIEKPQPTITESLLDAETTQEYAKFKEELDRYAMGARVVAPKLTELIERMPEVFDTDQIRSNRDEYISIIDTASCTNCAKNRLGSKAWAAFKAAVDSGNTDIHDVWIDLFPNHGVIRHGSKYTFRKDKKNLEDTLDKYTKIIQGK